MSDALMLRPVTITDAILTSTDAVESTAAWSSGTTYVSGVQVRSDTTHVLYESAIGASLGTCTISIASPGVVTRNAHGLANGTPVAFTTTGTLPTGLSPNTIYYVVSTATNTFDVAATVGGSAINTSGSQSGTHTLYSNPNIGNDPADDSNEPEIWFEIGPTNDWAMFDETKSTATIWDGSGQVVLTPGEQVDCLGLAGLVGDMVTVTVNDGMDDVYEQEVDLVEPPNPDWYSWFFQERAQTTTLFFDDLPAVAAPVVTILLEASDPVYGDVECGACQIGRQLDLGSPAIGMTQGYKDYSTYDDDGFGGIDVTDRGYALWEEMQLLISNARVGYVRRQALAYRGRPVFFRISDDEIAFGFIKRFDREIAYPTYSLVSLRVEETLE